MRSDSGLSWGLIFDIPNQAPSTLENWMMTSDHIEMVYKVIYSYNNNISLLKYIAYILS